MLMRFLLFFLKFALLSLLEQLCMYWYFAIFPQSFGVADQTITLATVTVTKPVGCYVVGKKLFDQVFVYIFLTACKCSVSFVR